MKYFLDLAQLMEKIEKISEKNLKIDILSRFIRELEVNEIKITIWLILGNINEEWVDNNLNVSVGTIIKVLKNLNIDLKDLSFLYKESGDLAEAVKIIFERYNINKNNWFKRKYKIIDIYNELKKIESLNGEESRHKKILYLEGIYKNLDPLEAKLLTRILQGDMRYGVLDGTIEDVLSYLYNISDDKIKHFHALIGDLGTLAEYLYKNKDINNISLRLFHPYKPMLAEKAENFKEAIDNQNYIFEFKFDGIRAQIHKEKDKIKIFTRRLKDVTNSFPDIVKLILENIKNDSIVLEGEIVAWDFKNNISLPFQEISKRIKREYNIDQIIKDIPVRLFLFDIIYLDGELLINKDFLTRRKILESVKNNLDIVPYIYTKNEEEAKEFFIKSINIKNEGLIAKKLNSLYLPGKRDRSWLKIKGHLEPLDLVIIGGEWGHGRRKNFISDLYLAARDDTTGKFLMITKTFKGLSDKEYEQLTKELLKYKIKENGRILYFKPKIVVETIYDEIQRSQKYKSGYALRFARINKIRFDKSEKDIDTIQRVEELYKKQLKLEL
ncbi:DNA ligase [Nanobdella aerobiophila]|uniref:DNA ligase n=1 Tax=Nanobdella aerobiophila TaxID=2586965 RepID=A0A915WRD7_9ARCH|nr:ATP-dependent DNA ligase [Nanobdella aerobiophila]BBL45468.1 DNA ligase [Nanobdella aerobiophila]